MSELLTALSVLFVVAGAFLLVASRFGLPSVPFLILAGLVAGRFVQEGLLLELARYGIALLVFTFGTRIQFDSVRTVLADSEVAALGQFLVTGSLGLAAGLALGFVPEQALYLGVATALSSTIVGTGLLKSDIRKNLVHGRLAETIHLVQDLLAILLVLVLSAEAFAPDPIATQLGYGLVLLVAGVAVNRYVFDLMGRFAEGSDELMLVGVIALLVAFLGLADLAGVSLVVGAFAAGVAVRSDAAEYLGVLNGLASITDFFVAVFFVTLGALVSVPTAEVFLVATVLGVLTAVVKPAVTVGLLIREGYEARSATLTGLSLDQVSEFALIIAIEALVAGVLAQTVFDAIILAAAVTMITSSLSRRYDERIYRAVADRDLLGGRHEKVDDRSSVPEDLTGHVVVVGYGRQGRRLVDVCERIDRPYVVVENDPALLSALETECAAHVFGDAMERYTWAKAAVDEASLVVSTVASHQLSTRLLSFADGTDVVLRADSAAAARHLLAAGALYVNVPDLLAAERLVEHIEALATGDRSPSDLRAEHLAELDDRRPAGSHTTADDLRARR